MKSYNIGGHRYTDPDVISLICSTDQPTDPRLAVLQKARDALQIMDAFGSVPKDPLERLRLLASICGISELLPLTPAQSAGEARDAFISACLVAVLLSTTTHFVRVLVSSFPSPTKSRTPSSRTALEARSSGIPAIPLPGKPTRLNASAIWQPQSWSCRNSLSGQKQTVWGTNSTAFLH